MKERVKEIKRKAYYVFYEIISWDWILITIGILSLVVAILIFLRLHFYIFELVVKESLELILTFNGLFSAILVTYFFNRISRVLDFKKEHYDEAVIFSQKITDFRRILKKLTDFYQVWESDDATKSLLESGKYKNIDYFDFKLSSFSDYSPKDIKLIEELKSDPRYREGQSDLYLGMISLVENRKSDFRMFDSELYKDFQTKGIYQLQFIANCVEIDYAGRLGYWFREDYLMIRYQRLSADSKQYILEALERIDSKKYKKAVLNNATMAEICDDMNEHYFKELHKRLVVLRKGLSPFNILIYLILIMSLIFGVLLPFAMYFFFEPSRIQKFITEGLIGINFGLLFFFIFSLYRLVKKEITWT